MKTVILLLQHVAYIVSLHQSHIRPSVSSARRCIRYWTTCIVCHNVCRVLDGAEALWVASALTDSSPSLDDLRGLSL